MRKLTSAFLIILMSLSVMAQSDKIDKRLLAKHSKSELKALKKNNPSEFKYLNTCLDNAWSIVSLPKEKMKNNKGRIGSIKIKTINKINFFDLNIEIIENDYQYFAIEGTEKMLVIKSKDHILKGIK
jgi:hypothetical protein